VPTYVYACRECDQRLEVVQKMSDEPLKECAACGGALRRVLFPPAVVYKGSGFYTTDYKNGGSSKPADEKKPEVSESTSEPKPETKPEAKTETKSETATTST
jgi:putative FmdB family regulatory protein